MKRIKKLAALALAVMMLMSLTVTAYAADGDTVTYKVTINNAEGHTYKIYQIFTGELSTKEVNGEVVDVLSNVKYGDNYNPANLAGQEVPENVLDSFDGSTFQPTGDGQELTVNGDVASIEGLEAGYYMVVDTTENLPAGHTKSKIMFQVVDDTEITSKHVGTTIEKKVQDINDSTGAYTYDDKGSDWIDSADYDTGDTVPFKSTAKFEGMANYRTYEVIFTDIMAPGLQYNNDMTVQVNGVAAPANTYTISTSTYTNAEDPAYTGGTEITVHFENIKAVEGVTNDATVTLLYTATLNADTAQFGAPGNPNKIRVKTIPDGEGGDETPWDVNIVFTYKVVVNKVDENKAPLAGAEFQLEKFVPSEDGEETYGTIKGSWVAYKDPVKTAEGKTFTFKGLDDGYYRLTETTTPEGYNTIEPVEFEVVAEHVVVAENPSLTSLTGDEITGEVNELVFTPDKTAGSLTADVENKSGTVLPETGGIGTTIFYALGATMVLVAVVLLVTKKRMASGE